jgi:hypothetical protein
MGKRKLAKHDRQRQKIERRAAKAQRREEQRKATQNAPARR